jgi:formate/nitrite transporter FocA (FNT family)
MSEEKAVEEQQVEDRSSPTGRVIYKAILQEGETELERPNASLFWSALAAGLSMGFSMMGQGLLDAYLPDAPWRPLVSSFGYSLGFLIVILGRQQLFTENTLPPVLPLLQRMNIRTLGKVLRLWGIVLVANLIGAVLFALAVAHTAAFAPEVKHAFAELGHKALENDFGTTLLRGIFAGWLIALMVWLLPLAETARVWVIIILTYFVGLAHLSHVIAGSVETFTVAAMGEASWGDVLGGFVVPALLGNIIGGVMLVAVLNHAQIVAGGAGDDL